MESKVKEIQDKKAREKINELLEKSLENPIFIFIRDGNDCTICDKIKKSLGELVRDSLFTYMRVFPKDFDFEKNNKFINILSNLLFPNAKYGTILGLIYKKELLKSWCNINEGYFEEYKKELNNIILS